MKARNNQLIISFGQWHTQTYDRHMLQNEIHVKLSQLHHRLDIVKIWNQYHDGKGYHQG